MSRIYLIISIYVNVLLSRGEECGGIVREGNEFSLNCSLSSQDEDVLWQLQEGAGYVNISSCGPSGTCTDFLPESFRASRRSIPSSGGETNIGQLKILSVNRTQNRFKCIRPRDVQNICNLQVYVKPDVPTCQAPSVIQIGTETYLKVICSSERIYPSGNCSFIYKGISSSLSVDVTLSRSPSNQGQGNYKITCSWTALISGLDPGSIQVQVKVYPNLEKSIEEASEISDWTQPTFLTLPTVALASNCPSGTSVKSGYILAGTQATCKCEVKNAGNPQGYAQWYNESGGKLGTNEDDGSALLTLIHGNTGTRYFCQPVSTLRQPTPQQVSFSPQYAVGPSTLAIDMSDAHPLCPNESTTYQIICKVPSNKGVPQQPLFTIIINSRTEIMNQRGQLDRSEEYYILTYTFRPDSGGTIRVYCRAVNEIFNELFSEHERPLIINEPPKLAPSFKTYNDQPEPGSNIAYITDGSNIHLTCRVDDGHPKVNNVTILCGNYWNTMQGIFATIVVNIPNNTRKIVCYCSAGHITGCYNKRSDIILTLDKPENPNKNDSSVNDTDATSLKLGLGIGLGSAILLLIVVMIAFIIVCKKRDMKFKENQNMHYSQPHYPSSALYHYSSFQPGLPALPQAPPPNQLGHSDYDLISLDKDIVPKSLAGSNNSERHETSTDPNEDDYLPEGYIQPI